MGLRAIVSTIFSAFMTCLMVGTACGEAPRPAIDSSTVAGVPAAEQTPRANGKSPSEIEEDKLGPPVRTKTFRVGPDGKPK